MISPRLASLLGLALLAAILPATARPPHLFLAGDSTMAEKAPPPDNPERGWGEALPFFMAETLVVDNRALNGRSSLSFRTEGHWDRLLADLRPGDAVLIQFGHNDQKAQDSSRYAAPETAYRDHLERFIREVREKGAQPLLATSIVRRRFGENGRLEPTHGHYPRVVREVAAATSTPLIDLQAATAEAVAALGPEASRAWYHWPTPGHFARFPEGTQDDTHLSLLGATQIVQLAVEQLRALDLPLSAHLKPPMPDPTEPRWIPLYPAGAMDYDVPGEGETGDSGRVENVRVPSLGIYRSTLGTAPRPAVVICPGGGYARLAMEHEGVEIARWFNALGFDAFVLKYRLKEFGFPAPLQDVARALRTVRHSAAEWGIDPARLGVLGFSAGGHVAGMATTLWDTPEARFGDVLDSVSARPDFSVLVYPVLTMLDPFTHEGSRRNLLGPDPSEAEREALSLQTRVTTRTPPVFLLHTDEETVVPAENSLDFARALRAAGVPVELHLFAEGPHGFGMRPGHGPVSGWPQLLANWLEHRGLLATDRAGG
ncbi:MAG: GDSL-type esterase/lipase family protein [Opitutales bacterium]